MENDILSIITAIIKGVNPITGELFDKNMLHDNEEISKAISILGLTTQDNLQYINKKDSQNKENRNSNLMFEELKEWRLERAKEKSIPPYCIFTNKELWSIAEGDVKSKEDLLFIKGISKDNFDNYADDLYEIIKSYIKY